MHSARKPWWQQVTALVNVSASGAITGLSFVPAAIAELNSPANTQIGLMALEKSAQPSPVSDQTLRSAIVNVTSYYLRVAADKTPAEMEAIIWQRDSLNGADHGASCAAFASLTLELAAQVTGQHSWVTGGSTYPWPLHDWVDARVQTNPESPGIISIQQDAHAHGRWHPLGHGYHPLPGDWVLFDGHVEVITKYAQGVMHTVGGDSLPDFSVNAHAYRDPLGQHGVLGFVNNGDLAGGAGKPRSGSGQASGDHGQASQGNADHGQASQGNAGRGQALPGQTDPGETGSGPGAEQPAAGSPAIPGATASGAAQPAAARPAGGTAIPGMPAAASRRARPPARHDHPPRPRREHDGPSRPAQQRQKHGDHQSRTGQDHSRPGHGAADGQPGPGDTGAVVPGAGPAGPAAVTQAATQGATVIPGLPAATGSQDADQAPPPKAADHKARQPAAPQPAPEQSAEQQFITEVSPGAVATQRKYGIPASVTIAQAIVESGWGTSGLATRDHNLFGIKGTGPAGSDPLPTREYEHGRPVTRRASFRVYRDVAQSIEDHGRLLATSGFYTHAMAVRHQPDTFASALTGVYATDPDYGGKLISLMRRHDLYRYDSAHVPAPRAAAAPAGAGDQAAPGGADIPGAEQAPPPAAPEPPPPDGSQTGSPGGAATPPLPSSRPVPATSTPPPTAGTPPPSPGTPYPSTTPPSNTTPPTIPAPPAATPSPAAAAQAVAGATAATAPQTVSATEIPAAADAAQRPRRRAAKAPPGPRRYQEQMPAVVKKAFFTRAKGRLLRTESLYRDVASASGIGWELLAACDWMQCEARDRWSPVHGERLGSANLDGTIYFTRSEALAQCADDLVNLAWAVYRIDLTAGRDLSVRDLASAFAAFRWGGLLKAHRTSAMEFPYSVAGLTEAHLRMRWPDISDPRAPDKPGTRFRMPFGAIPVVLGLNYQATV